MRRWPASRCMWRKARTSCSWIRRRRRGDPAGGRRGRRAAVVCGAVTRRAAGNAVTHAGGGAGLQDRHLSDRHAVAGGGGHQGRAGGAGGGRGGGRERACRRRNCARSLAIRTTTPRQSPSSGPELASLASAWSWRHGRVLPRPCRVRRSRRRASGRRGCLRGRGDSRRLR